MLSVAAFMMCDSDDTHIEISFHEVEVEVEPTEFDNPTALTDTESLDEITRRTCSSTGEDVTRKKCVICHARQNVADQWIQMPLMPLMPLTVSAIN